MDTSHRCSDKWCQQGGFISSVAQNTNNSATITFKKKFKDTNYTVCIEEIKNNSTGNDAATGGHAVYTKTVSNMVLSTYSWTNGRIWSVAGYIS